MSELSAQASNRDQATRLAFARTRAAYERTMMAWIRTATSLITFGFSIYKFFQLERPPQDPRKHLIGPRQFAMMLVGIGVFSLVLAILENHRNLRSLNIDSSETSMKSLASLVALLISVLGIIALVLIVFRQ